MSIEESTFGRNRSTRTQSETVPRGSLSFPTPAVGQPKPPVQVVSLEARFVQLLEAGLVEEVGRTWLIGLINRREATLEIEQRRQNNTYRRLYGGR